MKIFKAGLASLFALTAFAPLGNATLTGVPYQNLDSYAIWDWFTAAQFSNATPEMEEGLIFSATLTAAGGGFATGKDGSLYDRIYGGNRADDANFDFTIDVTAHTDITNFYLSLKFTQPNPAADPALTWTNVFTTVALNGTEGTPTFLGVTGEIVNDGPVGVVQWKWSGLTFVENDLFSISIQSPVRPSAEAGHVSMDSFAVTNIPEPSTWTLLAIGGGLVTLVLRRRKKFSSGKSTFCS